MAATVAELKKGRKEVFGSTSTVTIPYLVIDAADEAEARTALSTGTATTYSGLNRSKLSLDERVDMGSDALWLASVTYTGPGGSDTALTLPDEVYTFNTGGGSERITQSLETINTYGDAHADLGGAIGFDGETIQGTDIVVPTFEFSETHFLSDAVVTDSYKGDLYNATGTTNDATFRGLNAGECLFLGASGSKRTNNEYDGWEITFSFAARPNQTGLTIGTISGIAKEGWEYLWVEYGAAKDSISGRFMRKPVAVYVERVYNASDFDDLGI